MNIVKLSCTACGAPVEVAPDVEQIKCSYCNTGLQIQRSEGHIALKFSQQVSKSIEQGTETTQTELKRLQLGQEVSMLQMQLSTLQAEIRALERQSPTKQIKRQLNDLHNQEISLIRRIKSIQTALAPTGEYSNRSLGQDYQPMRSEDKTVQPKTTNPKNWVATYLLCMFLGFLGVHRFYTGHNLYGILQLITAGGFLIWWFIDLFLIALGKFKDSQGRLLSGQQSKISRYIAVGVSIFWAIYFLSSFGIFSTQ